MPIDPLPALDRNGPTFRADVDAYFVTALPVFATQAEAARVEIVAKEASAVSAAGDAYLNNLATASNAQAAASYAGAAAWATGTYAQYAVVYSPLDRRLYRKTTASSATVTDPSADPTNWAYVGGALPMLFISTNTTAVPWNCYVITGACTLTLPTAVVGAPVGVVVLAGVTGAIVNPGAGKIRNTTGAMTVDPAPFSADLIYSGASYGWI